MFRIGLSSRLLGGGAINTSRLSPSSPTAAIVGCCFAGMQQTSVRHATVVVGGSSKNHGQAKNLGRRRSPKCNANERVPRNAVLVTQRKRLEPSKQWHAGFNVIKGRDCTLNAARTGHVFYTYDTVKRRKFVHIIPGDHAKEDYMRPFYSPEEYISISQERVKRRIKQDPTVNLLTRNNRIRDCRKRQFELMDRTKHMPIEITMQQYGEEFGELKGTVKEMESIQPAYETEQKERLVRKEKMKSLFTETIPERKKEKPAWIFRP